MNKEIELRKHFADLHKESVDAIKASGNKLEAKIGYYECDTAGNVAAKLVAAENYELSVGGSFKIKMANVNTASTVTLNINNTGAKPLIYDSEAVSATNSWEANEVIDVYYDGTSYYANNVSGGGKFKTGEKVREKGIDAEPTAGSENLVKSGGVQNELALGAVYDVSAKNPTAGPNNDGKWESLSSLLSDANLNTLIPTAIRKGGMSVKFIQNVPNSDNKYVQYRLMSSAWSTVVGNWQEVVDGQLEIKLSGITAKGEKILLNENSNWYDGKYVALDGTIKRGTIPSEGVPNGLLIVNVNGYEKVRFLGVITTSSSLVGYGFSANTIDPSSTEVQLTDATEFRSDGAEEAALEYIVDVPEGMNYFACTIRKYGTPQTAVMTINDFYCYLQSGYPAASTFKTGEFVGDVRLSNNIVTDGEDIAKGGGVVKYVNKNTISYVRGSFKDNVFQSFNDNYTLAVNDILYSITSESLYQIKSLTGGYNTIPIETTTDNIYKIGDNLFKLSLSENKLILCNKCMSINTQHTTVTQASITEIFFNGTEFRIKLLSINSHTSKIVIIPNGTVIIDENNTLNKWDGNRIVPVLYDSDAEYVIGKESIKSITGHFINSDGIFIDTIGASQQLSCFIQREKNMSQLFINGNNTYKSKYAFLKSDVGGTGDTPDYCTNETGRREVELGSCILVEIPDDCEVIWLAVGIPNNPYVYFPQNCSLINESSCTDYLYGKIQNIPQQIDNIEKNYRNTYLKYVGGESIPIGNDRINYDDFIELWDSFLTDYPNIVTKDVISKDSSNTYDIYKYVFTPEYYDYTIFLTAGMHGNEYEGFWGLYRLMKYLYTYGYKEDTLRKILRSCRIICIPVLNPYGMQNNQRYNSLNYDQNYNYDVDWSQFSPHTGSYPFESKEPAAVKTVCDLYGDSNILFHIDFHTDPYSPTKGNYLEADSGSSIFSTVYNLTLDERQNIVQRYNYTNLTDSFVVWENTAATVFRYMELVRHIPSIIAETAINGFAPSGSAKQMEGCINWYLNCICTLFNKLT